MDATVRDNTAGLYIDYVDVDEGNVWGLVAWYPWLRNEIRASHSDTFFGKDTFLRVGNSSPQSIIL